MAERVGDQAFWNRERECQGTDIKRERLNKRFLEVFQHAAAHSRAYKELLAVHGITAGQIKSLDDLQKLPIIRMNQLKERQKKDPPFGGFETAPLTGIHRIYVNPGRIFQPGGPVYRDTSWAEAMCGAGLGPGDIILNSFNYHLWPYAFMLDESARMVGASLVPTGVGNSLMQVKIMEALGVNAFLGTPSFLMTLTQRAEGMGLDAAKDLKLEKAMVGAEMLPESLRGRLQKKLSMEIRQAYGTVLSGCLGYECAYGQGLHVPDNVLVEVVDPATGRPVEKGLAGEIVATCFNPLYPMIRLATGDLSLFVEKDCPCGRTGPMLPKVLGRVDQAAKVRGTFVHPWQTDEVISKYPEVFKYQIIITRENDVDVLTCLLELSSAAQGPERLAARIERDIKDFLTVKGRVKIVEPGSIPDFQKKIDDRRSWD